MMEAEDTTKQHPEMVDAAMGYGKEEDLPKESEESIQETELGTDTQKSKTADCEVATEADNVEDVVELAESSSGTPDWTEEIASRLTKLEELFSQRIAHTDFEENSRQIMHKELEAYKSDMYASLLKPLLMDVIEVREDIFKTTARYESKPEEEQVLPLSKFMEYATMDLASLLEKYDVEDWQSNPGDDFRPGRQKGQKKVPTNEKNLHGKIAKSLSRGYLCKGKVIRPERVSLYVYEAPEESASDNGMNGED